MTKTMTLSQLRQMENEVEKEEPTDERETEGEPESETESEPTLNVTEADELINGLLEQQAAEFAAIREVQAALRKLANPEQIRHVLDTISSAYSMSSGRPRAGKRTGTVDLMTLNPDDYSPRKAEVLKLYQANKSYEEIAAELGITRNTVSAHLYDLRSQAGSK